MAMCSVITSQQHVCCHAGDYLQAKVAELPKVKSNALKMANKAAKGKKVAPAPEKAVSGRTTAIERAYPSATCSVRNGPAS